MSSFATTAELAEALGRTLTSAETPQAERLLASATDAVRTLAGKHIAPKVDNEAVTLDGLCKTILVLPEFPVRSVDSVTVDGDALNVANDVHWYEDGRLVRRDGREWSSNRQSVVVEYDYGHDAAPDKIKGICIAAVIRKMENPTGVASESLLSHSVTYTVSAADFTEDERTIIANYGEPAIA